MTTEQRSEGTKYLDAFKWPQINLEDLSAPTMLMLMLHSRSRHMPDDFAFADYESSNLGQLSFAINLIFVSYNKHVLVMTGGKTRDTYGSLLSAADGVDIKRYLMNSQGMGPGPGLLTLEVQERIYRFLVHCCERILHNVPADELTSDRFPVQPPTAIASSTPNDCFPSLAIAAAEAPYHSPASLDLVRLEHLIAAKKSASEDHVWALREDPGYFLETLLNFRDHTYDAAIQAGKAPLEPAISNLISHAQWWLEIWNELHGQVQHVQVLQSEHASNIKTTQPLPSEYLYALLKFRLYLNSAVDGILELLRQLGPSSLRKFFTTPLPGGKLDEYTGDITAKPGVKREGVIGEVLWLLSTLWENSHDLEALGVENALDELDRLVQEEARAKDLITGLVGDLLADLGVLTQGLRQLKLYQPYESTFDMVGEKHTRRAAEEFIKAEKPWHCIPNALADEKKLRKLGDLVIGHTGRFYYPVEKRKTKENVDAMIRSEKNLDTFWAAVDGNVRMTRGFHGSALHGLIAQKKSLQRTLAWTEPIKVVKNRIKEPVISKPVPELYLDLEERTERTLDQSHNKVQTKKDKIKTKGFTTVTQDAPANTPTLASPVPELTFALDPRPLKVFRTLFFTPSVSATPGEVAWTDFLHAMVSTKLASPAAILEHVVLSSHKSRVL